jgi:hypothetical protein
MYKDLVAQVIPVSSGSIEHNIQLLIIGQKQLLSNPLFSHNWWIYHNYLVVHGHVVTPENRRYVQPATLLCGDVAVKVWLHTNSYPCAPQNTHDAIIYLLYLILAMAYITSV